MTTHTNSFDPLREAVKLMRDGGVRSPQGELIGETEQ